ncbi:MAG: phosphonate metabolism protein PhnM [delta proteobacterium ML8_F1]|nr:MAG: phosphonate metabolism protein PhnM [delta proteobacterium ML8_F1]
MKAIINGKLVLPEGIVEGHDLIIEGSRIKDIVKTETREALGLDLRIIDARGGYVSAGFIDIHADYIEHIAAPRPSSLMDFKLALREAERELLTHGVTTMYHSLSLYKIKQTDDKPIRRKENVSRFIDLIAGTHHKKHLIRHRFHARFEIDNVDSVEELVSYIEAGQVDLLSFMDHTPGQGQFWDLEGYKKMTRQYGLKMSDEELDAHIEKRLKTPKLSPRDCQRIAGYAREKGIAIASHDDDSIEKLHRIKAIGATISEFPITLEVAKKAKEMNLHTVAGAPNVLLGGSHSGNLSAHEAVAAGVVDILCSDYYPAAILHAVFKLHRDYGHDLSDMFKLVTLNPARAVHVDQDLGSIERGKLADLNIIEMIDGDFPVITTCLVDGEEVFHTHYRV